MSPRHALMTIGLLVAGWLAFFGDNAPESEIAQPEARAPASAVVEQGDSPAVSADMPNEVRREERILALVARDMLMAEPPRAQDTSEATPPQANRLFSSQSWEPPSPKPSEGLPDLAAALPATPALPFTYIGRKFEDDGWEVFLASDDTVFIVREKAVIDGSYRVDSITPSTLTLTYLPLRQVQTLNIGGTD